MITAARIPLPSSLQCQTEVPVTALMQLLHIARQQCSQAPTQWKTQLDAATAWYHTPHHCGAVHVNSAQSPVLTKLALRPAGPPSLLMAQAGGKPSPPRHSCVQLASSTD